ncbi:MAG: hypothetical protein IT371_20900 [Deltaproteobacteria bacterium]|nr:hypothetical protein [Deltaproteobacteria bacterium]
MHGQRLVRVDLATGGHELGELEGGPHYVGPVERALALSPEEDWTVLGHGPLGGSAVPGANHLTLVGRSPSWGALWPATLAGAGLPFDALGAGSLELRGRAASPSVLRVVARGGALSVELRPQAPGEAWRAGGAAGLLAALAEHHGTGLSSERILAVGPAAACTPYGALLSIVRTPARLGAATWVRHGGFGSRFFRTHQLVGIVLASDRSEVELLGRPVEAARRLLGAGLSLAELDASGGLPFAPELLAAGSLGRGLLEQGRDLLFANASSIHLGLEGRERFFTEVLWPAGVRPLLEALAARGAHLTCGAPCPVACFKQLDGQTLSFEAYAALGVGLGIVTPEAALPLMAHAERLGFEVLGLGGLLGWLMERLVLGLLEPGTLGLRERPRWDFRRFDAQADSAHNAAIARHLVDGLLAEPWAVPLGEGLRAAARRSDAASASLAVYLARGDAGEAPPLPAWSLGGLLPLAVPTEHHGLPATHFVPPRELGRRAAARMVSALMLQNLGVCRLHRGWAEELLPQIVDEHYGTRTDWLGLHRRLAHRLHRERASRFWESDRLVELVEGFLVRALHRGPPDGELDFWVRRFRHDRPSAARALWAELNAGLTEYFGA